MDMPLTPLFLPLQCPLAGFMARFLWWWPPPIHDIIRDIPKLFVTLTYVAIRFLWCANESLDKTLEFLTKRSTRPSVVPTRLCALYPTPLICQTIPLQTTIRLRRDSRLYQPRCQCGFQITLFKIISTFQRQMLLQLAA